MLPAKKTYFDSYVAAPMVKRRYRFFTGLFVATVISSANYYIQSKMLNAKIGKQDQIINRVNNEQETTFQRLLTVQNQFDADQINGKRIQITGSLQPGRFIVKRKKGDQQGYIVLAPYIVDRQYISMTNRGKPLQTKYMVNLGWVPKDSKSQIRGTSAIDVLPLNDMPDHLEDEEDWRIPITSTINAYVRKGEQPDFLNNLTNQPKKHIYKFIDLNLFANLFGNVNHSSRYVYLDRCLGQDEEESFPFPKSQESFKEQLENDKQKFKNRFDIISYGVAAISISLGAILSL